MKSDIILTPLRYFSTGLLQALGTGMSFARRSGRTLCFSPECALSSHDGSDFADHFCCYRHARRPAKQPTITPQSIQSP